MAGDDLQFGTTPPDLIRDEINERMAEIGDDFYESTNETGDKERDATSPPEWDLPIPDPVLWRDPGGGRDWRDPLIAVGDVGVLSGPGGAGKSTVTVSIARAAWPGNGSDCGSACGLNVRTGPVMLVSFESGQARLNQRLLNYGDRGYWTHLETSGADAQPLWAGNDGAGTMTGYFNRIWKSAERLQPSLIIIDPVSAAYTASQVDPTAARAFMLALSSMADDVGAGVLLVAHDTKGARTEASQGFGPGTGAVAGTSQWTDAARGVLHLGKTSEGAILQCVKANHAATGWGAALRERGRSEVSGSWLGLELDRRLIDEHAVADARRAAARTVNTEQRDDKKNDIWDYIRRNEGATRSAIQRGVTGNASLIGALISEMIDEGKLRQEQHGNAHRHYTEG